MVEKKPLFSVYFSIWMTKFDIIVRSKLLRAGQLKNLVRDAQTASTFINFAQEIISSIKTYEDKNPGLGDEYEGYVVALNYSIQHTISRKGWYKF